jgi:RNA polymerase sigma factor for flagellar operon FliA
VALPSIDPESHLGLVHYLARRMHRRIPGDRARTIALDDLLQAGFVGLLEAGRSFDPGRGGSFVAFARPRIVGAMLDLLGSLDTSTKRERRARRTRDVLEADLTGRLGRPPTDDEVATTLGTTAAELERRAGPKPHLMSLDDALARGDDPAAGDPTPEAVAAQHELARAVGACLEALAAEMRVVAVGRLLDGLTLEALGRLLRATKDRVWRLERAALRSLRTCLEAKGWEAADAVEAATP